MTRPRLVITVVVAALLVVAAAPVAVAQDAAEDSGLATSLLASEQAIEARLLVAAADPAMVRLANGIAGPAERRLARRTLAGLRGLDGPIVEGACIVRRGDRRSVQLQRVGSDSACASDELRQMAAKVSPGTVVRSMTVDDDGGHRLLLAAPLRRKVGGGSAVLSAAVDVGALFRRLNPAGADPAASMLVDIDSGALVALPGAPEPRDGVQQPDQEDLQSMVAGILAEDQVATAALSSRGLAGQVVPLWVSDSGPQLGIIEVRPFAPPVVSEPDFAIVLLAIVVVAILALLVGLALTRFRKAAQAESRLQFLYDEAREDSFFDSLTGLGNHRSFQAQLAVQVEEAVQRGAPLALALIDVDDLGAINDNTGQRAGDDVLTNAAEMLQQLAGPDDRAYRIGGDEFAMIMPGSDLDAAAEIMGRILHFCRRPASGTRPSAFSGGISAVPYLASGSEPLYRQASAALAWVKSHGRGSVEVFDPDRDHIPAHAQDVTRSAVQEVLAGKMLSPVYQPIVDLRNGRVLGFEGLIRPDPRGPLPNTGELFAAAAATGRTVELDLACIEVVLAGAREIGADRLLTLNLSPRTLEVKDFDAAWLLNGLMKNGISPSRVIVELTERDEIGDLRRLRQTLTHLQQYGLRFAADDVGAGNAGLRLLSQLDFDIVKIDLSLVQEGVHERGSRAVLMSLRDLAISQDSAIVAEGVETSEQLQVIRELQIGAGQGYLLGRPDKSVGATFVDVRRLAEGPSSPIGVQATTPPRPRLVSEPSGSSQLAAARTPSVLASLESRPAIA